MKTTEENLQTDWDYQLGMKIERMIQRHEQIADLKTKITQLEVDLTATKLELAIELARLENN